MKSIYILSVLISFMGLFAMGQSTIYTPWGSAVSVFTQGDMTPSQRDQMDQDHSDYEDDGAIFHNTLYGDEDFPWPSSTSKFNCHGYAWYMYWQTNPFSAPWNMNPSEAENYFSDPSFKECTKAEADIWWINEGSHSALATETTDLLKSKWATGPLATHYDDNQPTDPITSVTYYRKCSEEYTGAFGVDDTIYECAVKFVNSSISSYVDLEIEYEEAVLIEGPFTTGTGATLYIHPD